MGIVLYFEYMNEVVYKLLHHHRNHLYLTYPAWVAAILYEGHHDRNLLNIVPTEIHTHYAFAV